MSVSLSNVMPAVSASSSGWSALGLPGAITGNAQIWSGENALINANRVSPSPIEWGRENPIAEVPSHVR